MTQLTKGILMKKISIILVVLYLSLEVSANVITNYYDDFSGQATNLLAGTMPDITMDTYAWVENRDVWSADGSVSGAANVQRGAYLAFAPESGNVYEYSVDVNMTAYPNETDYLAVGFSTEISGNPLASDSAYLMIRGSGVLVYEIVNGTLNGGVDDSINISTNVAAYNFKMVLDTTKSTWTINYYIDGVRIGYGEFAANPSIQGLFINQYGAAEGMVDNLLLVTEEAPVVENGNILYYDDFSGLPSVGLDGAVPDTTIDGAVWTNANVKWAADGFVTGGANVQRGGFLPFSPEAGKVYEYSVKVDMTTYPNNGDYLMIGFGTALSGNPLAVDAAEMMIRGGGYIRYEIDGGTLDGGSDAVVNINTNVAPYTFKMVLDTTETAWTVEYYVDGDKIGDGVFSSNPSIQSIMINQYGAAEGSVDNLLLASFSAPPSIGGISLSIVGGKAIVGWEGTSAASYALQYRSNLLSAAWSNIQGSIDGADGSMYATNGATDLQGFYRIVIE